MSDPLWLRASTFADNLREVEADERTWPEALSKAADIILELVQRVDDLEDDVRWLLRNRNVYSPITQ